MARGVSLHVGLNSVDPNAYAGWGGALEAGESDALAMARLVSRVGYESHRLLSAEATADAVLDKIRRAAQDARAGDIFVLTYAGHGGQFDDLTNDESDRKDETWCLYDREILDDEISMALAAFRDGVRVVVLSDSCHSGTVTRKRYNDYLRARQFRAIEESDDSTDGSGRLRGVPELVQRKLLDDGRRRYQRIRAETTVRAAEQAPASILLVGACQDNQEALEDGNQGAFTGAVLDVWKGGSFNGDYRDFHAAIQKLLPPTQSPSLSRTGQPWPAFERQRPFDLAPPGDLSSIGAGHGALPAGAESLPERMRFRAEVSVAPDDPVAQRFFDVLRAVADVEAGRGRAAPPVGEPELRPEQLADLVRMANTRAYTVDELSDLFSLSVARVRQILEGR
jgi:hypothetical protein